jgi:Protein of unknown function (DUF3089)
MLDVQGAWTYYLQNDNQGRGVVLIGHSQGTVLLQQLIANTIDGTATQALLVSAFLAGDPSLGVPPGGVVGGTFAHIPTCAAAAQTGCVYASPAWVEAIGQFTGTCQANSGANIFVVTVLAGQFSAQNTGILKAAEVAPGWGVHPLDISLVQGNILDVLDAEIATWQAQH